ncbi:MAG: GumC family protein, partial [Vulcanimicrobiaceae bacterium]
MRDLWRILHRRHRAMGITFGAIVAIALLATLFTPRSYITTVKVITGNPAGPAMHSSSDASSELPVLNALLTAAVTQNTQTYAALFQQIPVAQQVVDSLGLPITPNGLLSHISVTPETNTSLLDLSASWSDPQESANIANAFAQAVMDRQRQLVGAQAKSAMAFLAKELVKERASVRASAGRLAAFESSHALADVNIQTQGLLAQVATVETKISETTLAERQAEAQIAAAQRQLADVPAEVPGARQFTQVPGTQALQTQLAQVREQLRNALQRFTSKHPTVIALKGQAQALKQQIASQHGQELAGTTYVPNPVYQQLQQEIAQQLILVQSAHASLSDLQHQQKALAPQVRALPRETMRYAELSRLATSSAAILTALQQRYDEAKIAASTSLSDVMVTQPASASLYVVRPDTTLAMLLGFIVAIVASLAVAFVSDAIDRRVKDPIEVARVVGLPVVADIPDVVSGDTDVMRQMAAAAFLRLASLLHFLQERPGVIAVTSAGRSEGKSTVALNLGLALAELGARTIVIDAGHIAYEHAAQRYAHGKRGFFDTLRDPSAALENVESTRSPLLDVMAPGKMSGTLLQQLSGNGVATTMEVLRKRYAYVIVDAPALSCGIQTDLLLRNVDQTLLVLRDGVSDLTVARRMVADMKAIGVT